GAGGQVSVFASSGSVDVVVDVLGWFPTGTGFNGLTPARLMDTRVDGTTIDGIAQRGGKVGGGTFTNLTVVGRGGVPVDGVGSVALNVTVTNPTVVGFVTVWPTGTTRPLASNLNFVAGQTVPNMVIVPVGAGGQVSVFASSGSVDVVVDVLGWFPTGTGFNGLTPARLMDTRVPAPPPPPPMLTFNPGTHLVNSDIPPGRYEAAGALSGCYWERESGLSGSLNDVIANDFQGFNGPVIVDILATDIAFKFQNACGKLKTHTAPLAPATTIKPGAHVVGTDIAPGTYTSTAGDGCYWARLSEFTGSSSAILANDFISGGGQQIVTISASDTGFYTNDHCGTWNPA
ncbi:MAG: hypothetical protein ABIQ39_03165, partial [Ilumatobacteraceae bacterium]